MQLAVGRSRVLALAVGATAVLLSACAGKGSGVASGSGSGAASGGGKAPAIGTRTIPSIGTVLDTSSGFTLYHNTKETNGTIVCTGGCASTWPPVAATGAMPTVAGVNGTWGTVKRPDGTTQLTFDGMPLYRYAGDTTAGQASGQGVGGVWFAVTTTKAAVPTSPSTGNGY